MASGEVLWVPRGISRNDVSRCWRVYAVSEQGVFACNVSDSEHDYSEIASLRQAYKLLIESHNQNTSRFQVDRRKRSPGNERDPLVDSGYTGVMISRNSRKGYKEIAVSSQITIQNPNGSLKHSTFYSGSVSEAARITEPEYQQQKLEFLIHSAVVVRRYYNRLRSNGEYPAGPLRLEDVPNDIRLAPVVIPKRLDVTAILDSYVVREWKPTVRTTGGDPGKLVAALQAHHPEIPYKRILLNGFQIRFIESVAEGQTFYLPKSVYRARGCWRLRIIHRHGIYQDEFTDDNHSRDMLRSLLAAWCSFFAELLHLEAPEPNTRWYATNALLDTCIDHIRITPRSRRAKKDQKFHWGFTVMFGAPNREGIEIRKPLASWRLASVTDEQIDRDLRLAAGLSAYRDYLVTDGRHEEADALGPGSEIPHKYFPEAVPCRITADDLWYHAEQINGPNVE